MPKEDVMTKLDEIEARADVATEELCGTEGQPMNWPGRSGGCRSCDARIAETLDFLDSLSRPFIVCPECGNKRCPKATWHGNECSRSNHAGQDAYDPVAEFIAHAREDVPRLVSALRAVESVLSDAEKQTGPFEGITSTVVIRAAIREALEK